MTLSLVRFLAGLALVFLLLSLLGIAGTPVISFGALALLCVILAVLVLALILPPR